MTSKPSIQYTIRGVPREVDQALRRRARERRISLNRLLIEELAGASGTSGSRLFRSLKGLAGCWKEDPEFDRALEEQRRIDRKLWQ
jgi:hypothetical protein